MVPIERADGESHPGCHCRGDYFVVQNGRSLLAIGHRRERLIPLVDLVSEERREALGPLTGLVRGPTRCLWIRARTWEGRSVKVLPISDELERLGFMREDPLLILYRESGGGS